MAESAVIRPALAHAVERMMGTVVGIQVAEPTIPMSAVEAAFAAIRDVDARFSPFKPDSEVSRLIRGELDEADLSADVTDVLGLCESVRLRSDGAFDARRHRPDGRPDPTGIVKGWAVERAARLLEAAGASSFAINAGGDVVVRGEPSPGRPWRVGIQHPLEPARVARVLLLRDGAVATSGIYERGLHIVDSRTGRPPCGLLSLTVVGPSLTYADAFATAAFAMGPDGVAWVARQPGYGAFAVTEDHRSVWTPLVDRLLD